MYITVKTLLQNLNYKLDTFFKLLNNCGYSKTNILSLHDLIELKKCINSKHYKTKLLLLEIDRYISLMSEK